MKTSTAREKNGTNPFSEMTDAALKNYEQAVRTSLKLGEEAGKWWSSVLNQKTFAPDWQKQFKTVTGMAGSLAPLAQRRLEEIVALMEKNGRAGAELMKKAVDAAQTPAVSESQAKWMEFWTSSLGAVRSNAEAVTEISGKAIDCWIEFVRKNTEAAQAQVGKAAA